MGTVKRLLLTASALAPLLLTEAQAQLPRDMVGGMVGGFVGNLLQGQMQSRQQEADRQRQQQYYQQQQMEAERQRAAARQAEARAHQQQVNAARSAAEAQAKLDRLRADPVFSTGPDIRDITVLVAAQHTSGQGEPRFPRGATACLPFGIISTDAGVDSDFLVNVRQQLGQKVGGSAFVMTTCEGQNLQQFDLIVYSRAQIANGNLDVLWPLAEVVRRRQFVVMNVYDIMAFERQQVQEQVAKAQTVQAQNPVPPAQPAQPVQQPAQQQPIPQPVKSVAQTNTIEQTQNNVTQNQVNVNNTLVVNLTSDAAEARGMITLFNAIIEEQRKMADDDPNLREVTMQAIGVLEHRVQELRARFLDRTTELSRYRTSIKPNDPDLQITARKASEIYPKVPYYIPGTPETGEFWIEPIVTDNGELAFNLRFIDPKAEHDTTRGAIMMTAEEVATTQHALVQVVKWAKLAHEKHIRRNYNQRAACFPLDRCPAETGPKRPGMASTEIDFRVYEDGSTAGRIQRNKGLFEDGYNISVDSASMLQAYVNHILTEGKTDFEAGSQTEEELRGLFKAENQ